MPRRGKRGLRLRHAQLAHERLVVAVCGLATLESAVEETVNYTKSRDAFGKPLFDMQNTRLELAECATVARIARVFRRRLHPAAPAW